MQSTRGIDRNIKITQFANQEVSGLRALSTKEFESFSQDKKTVILDVRSRSEFAKGHVPRSVFIGIDGGFHRWASIIIRDFTTPILLIAHPSRVEETASHLTISGFKNLLGFLEGGFSSWNRENKVTRSLNEVNVEEIKSPQSSHLIDVRRPVEYDIEHVPNAMNVPLGHICRVNDYPKNENYYLYCTNGYRSLIAASLMKSVGMENVHNIRGGIHALRDSKLMNKHQLA